LLIGLAAGLMGSLALAQLNPQGALGITAAIYAVVSFGGALGAIQFAPSNFLEVGGLMCAGVAVGVFLSVLVHPMVGGGDQESMAVRNTPILGCRRDSVVVGPCYWPIPKRETKTCS
jgi:hypothetical protein